MALKRCLNSSLCGAKKGETNESSFLYLTIFAGNLVRMKKTILLGLIWAWFGLLMSCNSEAFVKDFRTDVEEVHLSGTDDAITLNFDHGKWILIGTLSHGLPIGTSSFSFRIYDAAGVNVGKSSDIKLTGQGRAELRTELIQLDVERPNDTGLKIKVLENLLPDCKLFLTLQHKEVNSLTQHILVSLDPAHYEMDQIVYNLNSWGVEKREEQRAVASVIMPSEKAYHFTCYPYKTEYRNVWFSGFFLWKEGQTSYEQFSPLHLFDTAVEVEIPTLRPNGFGFEMKGDKALLTDEPQSFVLPNADQRDSVVVQGPGTFVVYKQVDYQKTINDCEIHVHNRDNGKKRVFWGILEQETPLRLSIFTQKQEAK